MGKVTKPKREKPSPVADKGPKVWEKARRDRMKILFDELSRLLPKFDPAVPPSRPEIIQKAMTHIRDLQAQNEDLLNGGFDEVYKKKLDTWKRRVKELLCRVEQLSNILRTANIHVPLLALEEVPAWTKNRPKLWTEKVKIPKDKVEEVIKQLSLSKKKNKSNKSGITLKNKKRGKLKKIKAEITPETQSKENQPTIVTTNAAHSESKPKNPPLTLPENQVLPVSTSGLPLQQTTVAHPVPNLIQTSPVAQPGTFILTNQGNLVPVLTPLIINRPQPLLVLQAPPQPQPRPLPVIISRPPPNKRRIDRESTVMTFANKRPISALSKHSHPRRGGKCVAHKTVCRESTVNALLPAVSGNVPAVSPTAAFLNSFPVVATPKIVGSEEGESSSETKNPVRISSIEATTTCAAVENVVKVSHELSSKNENSATIAKSAPVKLENNEDVIGSKKSSNGIESLGINSSAATALIQPIEEKVADFGTGNKEAIHSDYIVVSTLTPSKNLSAVSSSNIPSTEPVEAESPCLTSEPSLSGVTNSSIDIGRSNLVTAATTTDAACQTPAEKTFIVNLPTPDALVSNTRQSPILHNQYSIRAFPVLDSEKSNSDATISSTRHSVTQSCATNTNLTVSTLKSDTLSYSDLQVKQEGLSVAKAENCPVQQLIKEKSSGQILINAPSSPDYSASTQSTIAKLSSLSSVSAAQVTSWEAKLAFNKIATTSPIEKNGSLSSMIDSHPPPTMSDLFTSTPAPHWCVGNNQQSHPVTGNLAVSSLSNPSNYSPVLAPMTFPTSWASAPESAPSSAPPPINKTYNHSIPISTSFSSVCLSSSAAPVPLFSTVPCSAPVTIPSHSRRAMSEGSTMHTPSSYVSGPVATYDSHAKFTNPIIPPQSRSAVLQSDVYTASPLVTVYSGSSSVVSVPTTSHVSYSSIAKHTVPTTLPPKISCGAVKGLPPHVPASASQASLQSSYNSWLTLPPLYPGEKFNKTASTWRPIPADPVWTTSSQSNEQPWKVSASTQHPLNVSNPFGTESGLNNRNLAVNKTDSKSSSGFYLQTNSVVSGAGSLDLNPLCETTWSSGISSSSINPSYVSNVPINSSSTGKLGSVSKTNVPIPYTLNSSYPSLPPVQPILNENYPWGGGQHIPPLHPGSIQKMSSENSYPSNLLKVTTPTYSQTISSSYTNATSSRTTYATSSTKSISESRGSYSKNNSFVVSSASSSSLKIGAPIISTSSANFPLTSSSVGNPFSATYAPLLSSVTETTYSPNFVNTFGGDTPYSSKPSFSLDVPKALFNDPPYSLTVPKTPGCETFFSNIPMYQSAAPAVLTNQTSSVSQASNIVDSVAFNSSIPGSSVPERTRGKPRGSTQKETSLPLLTSSSNNAKNHANVFSEPKSVGISCVPGSTSGLVLNRNTFSNMPKQSTCDASVGLWNASYFSQTPGNISGDAWGQLDYSCSSDMKDHRPKPPINWMMDPDQRNDGLCQADDLFQARYQNVLDRKDSQIGHNMIDFCFNPTAEDETGRNKNRKKDTEPPQDYLGWASMKVDSLVVPSTLPTLVGDLALGSDLLPPKRCKTGEVIQEKISLPRSGKHTEESLAPPEPFTNLSKNIFDITQSEPPKPGIIPETIVLKNIFELPAVPSGKHRAGQGPNTFLSVSQLVEPHSMDTGPHKLNYTYYSQRSGKGKRSSGWKCGEKKCQQNEKSCSSYSAEALLRSNDAVPVENDFPLPGPVGFPLDFQTDPTLIETTASPSIASQSKPKSCASRSRKQEYLKAPDFKNNVNDVAQTFLSPSNAPPARKPDLPFSLQGLPNGRLSAPQPSNLHLPPAVSAALSYPRLPSNPTLLPGSAFPSSPSPSCVPDNTRYLSRYPGPRKPYIYARTSTQATYPYSLESTRKLVSKSSANIQTGTTSTTVPFCKPSVPLPPNSMLGSPLPGSYSSNPIIGSPHSAGSYSSKSATTLQRSWNPTLDSQMSSTYPPKVSASHQQSPNPPVGSPLSAGPLYTSKSSGKHQSSSVGSPRSLGIPYGSKSSRSAQESLSPAVGSPVATFPTFPPLASQTLVSSGSSLANFNLTTIFPEMNKKGYQYT